MDVCKEYNLPLSKQEMLRLARAFDPRKNGYFDYIAFLKNFVIKPQETVSNLFDDHRPLFTNQRTGEKLTIPDIKGIIRDICIRDYKTMKEAFSRLDPHFLGFITMKQLDALLRQDNVELSKDDLIHLNSAYDNDMNGAIDYEEFLKITLSVV